MDLIAYYVRYVAIYLMFGLTMALSSIEKLTDPVPQWFSDQFGSTFVADLPGLDVAWRVAGGLEVAVPVLLLISVVTLEIRPGRAKSWLKLGLGVAALTFMMLAVGQRITSQFDGAASLFFYFGATMATLLLVIFDESTYRGDAG
jgi:hypothetical protein